MTSWKRTSGRRSDENCQQADSPSDRALGAAFIRRLSVGIRFLHTQSYSRISSCVMTTMRANESKKPRTHHPLLVTGLGVGVHRILCKSLSFRSLSHPARRVIASARLEAAVPIVVLFSSCLAAGVSDPGASDLRGVNDGGSIGPLRLVLASKDCLTIGTLLRRFALARRLLAASLESL